MTPLETLSITHYQLSQSDSESFSCCQSIFQLKHLDMRGVALLDLDLRPLRGLLEKVADTLETLDLQGCRMKDSQLSALLPALRHCSQLTKINFYNNCFSVPILKDLLEHTVNWSKMNVEQYPAPLECYNRLARVSRGRFAQLCQQLMDTLREIRQPKNISFATENCPKCGERCVYGQGARLCFCWQWPWIQDFWMWKKWPGWGISLIRGGQRLWLQTLYWCLETKDVQELRSCRLTLTWGTICWTRWTEGLGSRDDNLAVWSDFCQERLRRCFVMDW